MFCYKPCKQGGRKGAKKTDRDRGLGDREGWREREREEDRTSTRVHTCLNFIHSRIKTYVASNV